MHAPPHCPDFTDGKLHENLQRAHPQIISKVSTNDLAIVEPLPEFGGLEPLFEKFLLYTTNAPETLSAFVNFLSRSLEKSTEV